MKAKTRFGWIQMEEVAFISPLYLDKNDYHIYYCQFHIKNIFNQIMGEFKVYSDIGYSKEMIKSGFEKYIRYAQDENGEGKEKSNELCALIYKECEIQYDEFVKLWLEYK